MKVYLERKGIKLSNLTVHKYMNKELKLSSIVRRKKPNYRKGKPHKIFDNLIKQGISGQTAEIKNGVQILHICFLQMEAKDITAQY